MSNHKQSEDSDVDAGGDFITVANLIKAIRDREFCVLCSTATAEPDDMDQPTIVEDVYALENTNHGNIVIVELKDPEEAGLCDGNEIADRLDALQCPNYYCVAFLPSINHAGLIWPTFWFNEKHVLLLATVHDQSEATMQQKANR